MAFAAKLGVKLGPGDIPPKQAKRRVYIWGPGISEDKSMVGALGVNGELAQIHNIADAARMVEAIIPAAVS
jgi:hypothetical protein